MDLPRLDAERVAASPLHRRVVFVLAPDTAETRDLVAALAALPDVAARPTGTFLFAQGLPALFGNYLIALPPNGIPALADQQEFLLAARLLADEPLLALRRDTGAEVVVDWSPGHEAFPDLVTALYPDARVIADVEIESLLAAGPEELAAALTRSP